MKKTFLKTTALIAMFLSLATQGLAAQTTSQENDLSSFKSIYDVNGVELTLPKPLKITLPNPQDFGVAVIETKSQKAQPVEIIERSEVDYPKVYIEVSPATRGYAESLVDRNPDTTAEFDLDANSGKEEVELSFEKEITSSSLTLELADHVAPPYMISIQAKVEDKWITVLAEQSNYDTYITFPQRTSKNWKINFSHSQPLVLREIILQDDNLSPEKAGAEVVWLAKPGESYKVYADAAIYKSIKTGELGNLLENPEDIVKGSIGKKQENPEYKDPDSDGDEIPNYRDNCVNLSNPKQEDLDKNKRGDACEDHDKDGIIDSIDNCPNDTNIDQRDTDEDKIGDICDAEESRPTERMPWLPWAGMGVAAVVVMGVIIQTLRRDKQK